MARQTGDNRRVAGFVNTLVAPDFTSSEQTVTFDTVLDVAHSLGARPTLIQVVLVCKTTQHGFAVDDEIIFAGNSSIDNSVTINMDATNVTIVQGANILIHNQSTLNASSITVGSWKWVVRAWL